MKKTATRVAVAIPLAILPPLFGFREVTFWQAHGLLALCRILFGGLGLHSSGGSRARRPMAERWGFVPSSGESKEGESR